MANGYKVKLRLKFRGREMAHTEIGFDVIKRSVAELEGMGHPDAEAKLIGRNIHVMLTPLPINKRKPKFHIDGGGEEEEADAAEAPEAPCHPAAGPRRRLNLRPP